MTKVELIYNENNKIQRVIAKGHANFREENDIICASVSSITQTALLGLIKVVGLDINYVVDDGYLSFEIPEILDEEDALKVDVILDTMKEGINDIVSGYGKFVNLEEKYNVY